MKHINLIRKVTLLAIALPLAMLSIQAYAGDAVVKGTFEGASNHVTTGGVSVVETADGLAVVLASDFSFDGAPDPKVGFGKSGKYDISSQLDKLQSNSGEQTYLIPDSVDVSKYNEIYIWCEAYSVPLGVAKVK